MTVHLPVLSYLATPSSGGVAVSLDQMMVGGLLLQAGSGGGKSRAIRQALEETHGRVQHLVIDPEGEFASLREKFDYVYAAPHGGDTVATPKTARLLCRRLVEIGASAVLDIYDLKVPEKREFVRLFLEELMVLPRTLWKPILVVVDEADLFAPQSAEATSTDAIIDVNGRGRKRGYRMIVTTRRISKLHKDVADQQNRMIGRTGLDLDVKRAGDELGMDKETRQTLPRLSPGVFYVYGPAISATPQLVQTGIVQTSHPEAGRIGSVAPPAPAKVRALLAQLADLPKEAEEEAKTLEELRRANREKDAKIRQLEKTGGAERVVEKTVVDQRAIGRAVAVERKENLRLRNLIARLAGSATRHFGDAEASVRGDRAALGATIDRILSEVATSADSRAEVGVRVQGGAMNDVAIPAARASVREAPIASRRPSLNGNGAAPSGGVTGVEQRILNTLAGMEALGVECPDKATVAALVGYHPNAKSYANAMGSLRTGGRVAYVADGRITLTDDGRAIAENSLPVSSRDELHRLWYERLGNVAERILAPLLEAHPDALPAAAVAEIAGYHPNAKSFANMKGRLRTLGLIDYPASGMVVATDVLFPKGLR